MGEKILLIDDSYDIYTSLELSVPELGYELEYASDGKSGLEMVRRNRYALILLDLEMPGMGGMEVCKTLREENSAVPIIMLTSRCEESTKVAGLSAGADDYITKPFGTRELLARIGAAIRRADTCAAELGEIGSVTDLTLGKMQIIPGERTVTLEDEKLDLTALEFDLLYFLATHQGRVVTKEEILEHVWDGSPEIDFRSISTAISRLRAKLEQGDKESIYVQTVWGVGYKFVVPDADRVNSEDV